MTRTRWGVLLVVAVLAAQQEPVLRVTTRLVEVSVIVTDKKDQAVDGLTKNDFTVIEDSKPQKIESFSVEKLHILPPPAEPLPPDIYTNRYELKGGAPSAITIVLLDMVNTAWRDKLYSREELVKFLRDELRASDRVALYALSANLYLLHDFTSDIAPLIEALGRYKPRPAPDLDESIPAEFSTGNFRLDDLIAKGETLMYQTYAISRANRTTAALEAIAARVAALPGRKNLVWISGGFPIKTGDYGMGRNFRADVERATAALAAANVAVYPVDAKGLVVRSRAGLGMPNKALEVRETMQVVAERTGGKTYLDSNDIRGAVRRAIDDTKLTYVIVYRPGHDNWDGHFQRLTVKVKRSGVNVRHRNGYVASADEPTTAADRASGLERALANPLEATGIRLMAAIKPDIPAPGRLAVRIMIEPADVSFREKDGRWTAKLDMAYVQWPTPAGEGATLLKDELNLHMSPEAYAKTREDGLIVQKALTVAASAHKLRIVVRDANFGATGSVEILRRYAPVVSGNRLQFSGGG
jgi:VWFA-related protein